MSVAFAQRAILLGAVTLIGIVAALGVAERLPGARTSKDLPQAVPAPGGGWYHALALKTYTPEAWARVAGGR